MVIGPNFVFLAIARTASQMMTYHFLPPYGGVSLGIDSYHRMDVPMEHVDKFTFSVVRNPYDRMLSLWYLIQMFDRSALLLDNILKDWTPAEFVMWCATQTRENWQSQTTLLLRARVDQVLRFENLEADLRSLPFVNDFKMPLVYNAMDRPPVESDLTPEFIAAVNVHSEMDFIRFGYEIR